MKEETGTSQRKARPTGDGFVSKITLKGIGCAPVGLETPTRVAQVYGRASGTLEGLYDKADPESDTWICLVGEFEAVNLQTGDIFRSARLFLPNGIQDILQGPVEKLKGTGIEIVFAMELQTVKSSNKAGYSYKAIDLMPPTEKPDMLMEMRRALTAGTYPNVPHAIDGKAPAALPAPAPAPAAESAPAPAAPGKGNSNGNRR